MELNGKSKPASAGFLLLGENEMAIETFTWRTQGQPEGSFNQRVRVAKFGDGYEQVLTPNYAIRIRHYYLLNLILGFSRTSLKSVADQREG